MLYNITDVYELTFHFPCSGMLEQWSTCYVPAVCLAHPGLSSYPQSKGWQAQRRMALYHSAMAHIIPELNDICAKDDYYWFADKLVACLVRQGRGFWHLLCMDGAEIAAATMCCTDNCPTCECPKAELDSTEHTYPLRSTETIRKKVEQARAEHLKADGAIKQDHKEKVCSTYSILHVI